METAGSGLSLRSSQVSVGTSRDLHENGEGIERILSVSADNIKVGGSIDLLESRKALQSRYRLMGTVQLYGIQQNRVLLHCGCNNPLQWYSLREEWLEFCLAEKNPKSTVH